MPLLRALLLPSVLPAPADSLHVGRQTGRQVRAEFVLWWPPSGSVELGSCLVLDAM